MAIHQGKSSIGNYAHHRFIFRRALASELWRPQSFSSLVTSVFAARGSSLGVETREREDNPSSPPLRWASLQLRAHAFFFGGSKHTYPEIAGRRILWT